MVNHDMTSKSQYKDQRILSKDLSIKEDYQSILFYAHTSVTLLSGVPEQTPLGHCLSIRMSTSVFFYKDFIHFLYTVRCTVCYVMDYRGIITYKSQITVTDIFYCHKAPYRVRVMGLIN